MITAEELRSSQFTKAVRGYSPEEVNVILEQAADTIDAMAEENAKLSAQLSAAGDKLAEYKSNESAVLKTLEAAKALMNDISASAEKRAQVLIRNAEIEAESKRQQADDAVARIKEEETRTLQRLSIFKERYKALLRSELEKFDDFSDELLGFNGLASAVSAPKTGNETVASLQDAQISPADLARTLVNVREDEQ